MEADATPPKDGVGVLNAVLASLEPALAAAYLRLTQGDKAPPWFAAPAAASAGECIEVLGLDGTILFVGDGAALPAGRDDATKARPGFWLRQDNDDARRAMEVAAGGITVRFQTTAETQDGEAETWDVVVTGMRAASGEVDALLVVSRRQQAMPAQDDGVRQKTEYLRRQEESIRRREVTLLQRERSARSRDAAMLRDAMDRLDLALNAGPVIGTWVWNVQADRMVADARLARALSVDPMRAAAGLPIAEFMASIHPEDRSRVAGLMAEVTRKGGEFRADYRLILNAGHRWVQASGRCELDPAGRSLRFPGVLVDVHDRVELERAAEAKAARQTALLALGDQLWDAVDAAAITKQSAALAGQLLGASNAGFLDIDPASGGVTVSPNWTAGRADSLAGHYRIVDFAATDIRLRSGIPVIENDIAAAGWMSQTERDAYRDLGLQAIVSLPHMRDGVLVGVMFVAAARPRIWTPEQLRFVRDVADRSWAAIERVQAEEARRTSTAELHLVADSMPMLISMIDQSLIYRFINQASLDWIGLPPEQIIGRPAHEVLGQGGIEWRKQYFNAALAGHESRLEAEWPHRDGTPRVAEIRYLPRQDARGGHAGFYAFVLDITERKRAERKLQGSADALEAEVMRRTAERDRMWLLSTDIMLVAAFDGAVEAVNPAWTATLGWTDGELVGADLLGLVHPDDLEASRMELDRLSRGERTSRFENRLRHRDGSYRWLSWSAVPDDRFLHAAGRDITAERDQDAVQRHLEEQLRQSQKMEAVGQLTGGLAHDFNNLLTGITGSLEVLQTRLTQGRHEGVERYIEAAQNAANRAAALTHRLLAFSRRQTLDPKPTNLNRLVDGIGDLIRGTIGPAIPVETMLGADLWPVLCDPNQLENALLNLCINARDSMPGGGQLTIETANARLDGRAVLDSDMAPGDYVTLSVTDTGNGMTPEVAARAFDPFYTTKPLGEGTGLGLSMTYGFVKQSGGQIQLYTEAGHGTTVQLMLPRHSAEPIPDAPPPADAALTIGDGETVLLVDDEPAIRQLVTEVLEELGYTVLQVADGKSGLALLQSNRRIDLLISDVGLPGGMNGRELADAARIRRPGLKVLFITGYAANAVIGAERLSHGMHVMTKPFSMSGLAMKIRAVLAED